MKSKFCDSPIHKFSSLVLAFIILSICLIPSLAHAEEVEPSPSYPPIHPNVPVGYQDGDTFRDILAVVLDSWGISFSSNSSNSLLDDMDMLLEDFYESQNTYADMFWEACQYGVNKTGELILDHTTIGQIIKFANWLISEYNLSNNSSSSTAGSSFITMPVFPTSISPADLKTYGVRFFNADSQWFAIRNDAQYNNNYIALDKVFYPYIYFDGSDYYGEALFYSDVPIASGAYVSIAMYSTGSSISYTNARIFPVSDGYYRVDNITNQYRFPESYLPRFTSHAEALAYYNITPPRYNININTQIINVPAENDISPDDGLRISVPGTNWGDSIFTILDLIERLIGLYDSTQLNVNTVIELITTLLQDLITPTTVENIPGGVIMDYDEYDIPIENEWGLFDIFYNTDGEDISILSPWQQLTAIIYGFPAPVLSLFALVVLFVVAYGFIRMGRDSH